MPGVVVAVVPRDNILFRTRGLVPADLEKQTAIRLAIGPRPSKDAVASSRELVVVCGLEPFNCCNRNGEHSASPLMAAMDLCCLWNLGASSQADDILSSLEWRT